MKFQRYRFDEVRRLIPFIPSIPSVLGISYLGVHKGVGWASYVVAAKENKNLPP
jgi:hypothetical protein